MTEQYPSSPPVPGYPNGYPPAQGPFQPQPSFQAPEADDFSGDDVWKFSYNFGSYAPKGKEIRGEVPTPTQPRIDAYERQMSRIGVELEYAAREESQALARLEASQSAAQAGPSVEEAMEAVERAFRLKGEVLEKLKDTLAAFCGAHPTRKQFDLLPENALFAFNNAIRKKLNPNF